MWAARHHLQMSKTGKMDTNTRQRDITNAALTLASQKPPAEVTTADVARAVGITQGAVYRHFSSKEAIWLAVMDQVHVDLMKRLQSAVDDTPNDPASALRRMFLAHVDFVMAHPGVPRVLFQELQSPDDTPLKERARLLMSAYRQLLLKVLGEAREQGILADDVDIQSAVALFIGSIQGLVMQSLLGGELRKMRSQGAKLIDLLQAALVGRGGPDAKAISTPRTGGRPRRTEAPLAGRHEGITGRRSAKPYGTSSGESKA